MLQKRFHSQASLLAIAVCFASMLAAPVFAGQQEPVWMFNFKDTFLDIACINEEQSVIVGDRGQILVTHGTYKNLWSPRDSKTTEMLTSLSFVDDKHGWAAGHGGIIIHTQDGGESWEVQREASPQNLPLFDIQFVSREIGYASGAYDTLLKSVDGGESWSSIPTGTDVIYNGLFFHDPENGFLLGEFGSLLKTSDGGASWEQMNTGDHQGTLFGITFLSPQKAIAYGISGKLLVSDDAGENWTDIPTGTEEALFMAAANGGDVVIVGKSGIILLSIDSANSFINKYGTDNYSLAGVCARPGDGFVAVGEFGTILNVEAPRDE
jgi:photosystem II stability/assembly factor-like uncharacterized protein